MSEKLSPEAWHAMPEIQRDLAIKAIFARPLPTEPPDVLFHYTAPDAFATILEKHGIWLTNAAYLNDQGELAYPVQLAREYVDDQARNTIDISLKLFLSVVHRTLESHSLYKSWYVSSLTTEGDLLSQWRAYCPRGGYSLGLYGPRLVSILLRHPGFELRPVVYDRETQIETLQTIFQKYQGIWRDMANKYPEVPASERDIEVAGALNFVLSQEFVAFKSPAFAEEREWRIVRYFDGDDKLQFRERQGLLTPYIDLDLSEEDGKLPFAAIHTSPLVEGELAKHAATLLLEQEKYERSSELIKTPTYRLRF